MQPSSTVRKSLVDRVGRWFHKGTLEAPGEHVDCLRTVDIVLGMLYEFFKVGNVPIKILSLHSDFLAEGHLRFFFLEGVSELSIE